MLAASQTPAPKIPLILRLFWGAYKAIWLVNFALPLKAKCSFTLSKLRFVFLLEAQNSLNSTTFLIQNSRLVKAESGIEPLSAFFVGRVGLIWLIVLIEVMGIIGTMGIMGV